MALINILARLGIDSTSYQAGLKKAESAASAAGRVMRSHLAQAFTVAAVSKLANDVSKLAGRIKDSAEQFGLTRRETQEMMRVAEDSGVSFEMLAQSINKVTRQRAIAAAGDKNAVENFRQLGIGLDRVVNESERSADIFFDIARALNGADLATQGAAIKILGDESSKMFGAMRSLAQIGPMVIVSDDQVEAIDKAAKALSHLVSDVKAIAAISIGESVKDYEFLSKLFGGGGRGKFFAGAISGLFAYPMAVTRGLMPEGNKNMGRLDLDAGLADRDARMEARQKASSIKEKIAARAASIAVGGLSAGSAGSGGIAGSADPLAKIGGLFFGADAGMRAIPQRQLDELRRLNARVERIERAATAD